MTESDLPILRDSLLAANLFELLDQHELARFDLDKRHVAIRLGMEWVIYQRQPDGWLHPFDRWTGTSRSILERLRRHGIEPSIEAEAKIAGISDRPGFSRDGEEPIDT